MIRYTRGNLLEAEAEALVNTVNEVGVMGKGVALMFRDAFPDNADIYREATKERKVKVGHMLVTANPSLLGPRWIINFPTKKHWRQPSRIEWIRAGLKDLVQVLRERKIRSVALPPLGCGNGGLEWALVRREIEGALAVVPDVDVIVFEPISDYLNAPKRSGLEALTPARALIAELVRRYSVLGLECSNLEVHKLAWFLQRVIDRLQLPDPLDLRFEANLYGPYADRLRHLLDGLDGSYLHCEKRLSDAKPLDAIWFEDSKRRVVAEYLAGDEGRKFKHALEETEKMIDGFESPLGMELLATVDWLISREGTQPTLEGILEGLSKWPGGKAAARRKLALFDERVLGLALDRVKLLN